MPRAHRALDPYPLSKLGWHIISSLKGTVAQASEEEKFMVTRDMVCFKFYVLPTLLEENIRKEKKCMQRCMTFTPPH